MVFPTRFDLESYAGHGLPAFEAERVRKHLRGCTDCALRVADLKWIDMQTGPIRIPNAILRTAGCDGKAMESAHFVAVARSWTDKETCRCSSATSASRYTT